MSKGKETGRKFCMNCSADLTSTSSENKNGICTLNCSSRVRSPLRPATVELIPVHQALATIFNFETLEKVTKVSVGDATNVEDDLENENPFMEFQSSVLTAPICYVCYLVFSDLYRTYSEFSQLRKSNSFLRSKLNELESKLIARGHQSHQSQKSSACSTSGSISNPNQVPHSIRECNQSRNPNRTNTLKNAEVNEISSATFGTNKKTSVNSQFITLDYGRDLDSDLKVMPQPTTEAELTQHSVATGSCPFQGQKRLLRSSDLRDAAGAGTMLRPFQAKNVEIPNVVEQKSNSDCKKIKLEFSNEQVKSNVDKTSQGTEIQNAMKPSNSMQWKSISCNGLRRHSHKAVAVNGSIYSFGGEGGKNSSKDPIDIHVLNTSESPLRWKLLPSKTNAFTPSQRYSHSVMAFGHLIYLWGGLFRDNRLYVFNTETLKWEKCKVNGELPSNRSSHTATLVRNKMYVIGGLDYGTRKYSNEIMCLDLTTHSWSSISSKNDPPKLRFNHSATVHGDRFILIFGEMEEERYNSLVCFDVETNEWMFPKVTGTIPQSRQRHCAFNQNGFMYIFGGYGNNSRLNDLFSFDFEGLEWKKVIPKGPNPDPRENSQSVVIANKVFIFGGSKGNPTICDDTLVLTIE